VTGVQDQLVTPGQLNDDINQVFVINFSEAMVTSTGVQPDANSIVVYDTTNEAYVAVDTAEMSTDGRSMTVTTTAAVSEGATLHFNLLRADFQDVSGNNINDELVAAADNTSMEDVGFDSVVTSAANATDVYRLTVRVFREINTTATAVTLAQMSADSTGTDDDAAVQASNGSFADVLDDNANFQQLDSSDDDDTAGGPDAEERKGALVVALGGAGVEGDVARLSFTPVNASYYDIAVTDTGGADQLAYNAGGASTGTATLTLDTNTDQVTGAGIASGTDFRIEDLNGSTAQLELVLATVEPGMTVTITPYDDFGYAGTPNSLVLIDNVAPTAVLQNSYGVTPTNSSDTTSVTFGDGGELSNIGTSTVGLPILNVTPQLLDNLEADNDGDGNFDNINEDGVADDHLQFELMENNAVDTAGTGSAYLTPAAIGPYDATAYAAMVDAAVSGRTIGFSISEDAALTGTAPAFSGTNSTLSGYAVSNDVTVQDDGAAVNVDLVNADVDNVFSLAADDTAVVDFANAIQDTATTPNVAANASVVIRDAMPPMVVSAIYNGTSIVVTFNEAIAPDLTTDTITIGAGAFVIGLTNATLSAGNTVLTILPEDGTFVAGGVDASTGAWVDAAGLNNANLLDTFADLDASAIFTLSEYSENGVGGLSYTTQGANAEGHAIMDTSAIPDAANGNTWDADSAGVTYPTFAIIEATGDLASSVPGSTFINANVTTTSIVSWGFTHPIDFYDHFNACATSTTGTLNAVTQSMDDQAVQDCFTLGGVAFAAAGSSAVFNTTTNQLTVTFETAVAPATGNTIDWNLAGNTITSEYDTTDTAAVPQYSAP